MRPNLMMVAMAALSANAIKRETKEALKNPGIRSIRDLFATHRPIPAIKTSASTFVDKKQAAEQKRLKRQQRNLRHASGFTHI